jgi:23S rRNA pseudouridine2605 synthase
MSLDKKNNNIVSQSPHPQGPDLTHEKPSHDLVRLNRFCAQSGLGSRRFCDTLISSGKIVVNGAVIKELGTKINPDRDKVQFRGAPVRPEGSSVYMAYHKPRGVMVTKLDPQGRETIYTALAKSGVTIDNLRYIGRLDFNSEGLLLLTNDGNIIHSLTHPRYHIKKVYEVCIDRKVLAEDIKKMVEDGVVSENQTLRAGKITPLQLKTSDGIWYSIDLYEGKRRQIRRMFEALGYSIARLIRVQFASAKIGDLQPGKTRLLSEREIAALLAAGYPQK